MIVDVHEFITKHPKNNKLIGRDFLFVEYKCPLKIEEIQLLTKYNLISYVIKGRKDWMAPNETRNLVAGDALFIKKGVYRTKQYFDEEYCVMLFFLNDNFIKNFIHENNQFKKNVNVQLKNSPFFKINTDSSFKTLIESMFHYLNHIETIPENLVINKFSELLFNIFLNSKNKFIHEYFNLINHNSNSNIRLIMEENYQYDLKIDGFAKLCNKSLSSFKRSFKDEFKITPAKWLKQKRLETAKTLMSDASLKINQIGYACGFNNPSHFIRIFKNEYGLTPNQFKIKQQYLL
jgi:AraC-like DNA-binding protein